MIGTSGNPAYRRPVTIEFLLGPAGSGKTRFCVDRAREVLRREPDGKPLIFLTPKQATFQLERQLLATPILSGFSRLQIVSFDRLALFLRDHFGRPEPQVLSDEGRVMVLRSLLIRHETELAAFRASARTTGFARALSGWLRELQQHRATPDALSRLAADPITPRTLRDKLKDAALLLARYREWLNERELHDPDELLPLSMELLRKGSSASGDKPLGWLWLDGFAELTPAELDLLEWAVRSSEGSSLAFCVRPNTVRADSGFDLWANIRQTFHQCYNRLATLEGAAVQIHSLPAGGSLPRFIEAPILERLESQIDQTVATPIESDDSEVSPTLQLWECAQPEAEAELAAGIVLEHVQSGGRFRDIGIVPRSLEGYADPFRRIFRRHGIPLFIDHRAAVAHHPATELTRAVFRLLSQGWQHGDFFALLKTGLVLTDDALVDRLENTSLRNGWEGEAWHSPLPADSAAEFERARLIVVDPLLKFSASIGDRPSGRTIATAIRKLWALWKIEAQLITWAESGRPGAPHATVWRELCSWLENVELGFADDCLALAEWSEVFESALAGLNIGLVPPALDQVLLGAVDRSRNPDLKIVLVPGLNDQVFPAAPPNPILLGHREMAWLEGQHLGRSSASLHRLAHERFFAYIALTRASRRVIASWSAANAMGHALQPSSVVRHLRQIFPRLNIRSRSAHPEKAEEIRHPGQWLMAGLPLPTAGAAAAFAKIPLIHAALRAGWSKTPPDDHLELSTAEALYGLEPKFSPSGLERYAECPFEFFALNGLRCAERSLFEVDLRFQGRFEHAVLARFHNDLIANQLLWRDLSRAEIRRRLDYAIERELQAPGRAALIASPAALFRSRAIADRLELLLQRLVDGMRSHGFDPAVAEVRFSQDLNASPGGVLAEREPGSQGQTPILLEGRIDRIDRATSPGSGKSFVLVSDYKRRKRAFDEAKFRNGTAIQAVLYLAAAMALESNSGAKPAGWVWVPLATERSREASRSTKSKDGTEPKPWMRGRLNYAALESLQTNGHFPSPFSIKLKKDGQPHSKADLRPEDQMEELLETAWKLARGLAQRILSGAVEPSPLAEKQSLPCDHCGARDICRFEPLVDEPRKEGLITL